MQPDKTLGNLLTRCRILEDVYKEQPGKLLGKLVSRLCKRDQENLKKSLHKMPSG